MIRGWSPTTPGAWRASRCRTRLRERGRELAGIRNRSRCWLDSEFTSTEEIGCRALLIHAEDDEARSFYEHLVPELEPSPTDPLHLVLLLKDLRRTLRP